MKFTFTDTNQEILDELGKRVAGLRLSMNWSQQAIGTRRGEFKSKGVDCYLCNFAQDSRIRGVAASC